jgi:hypothetical protein
MVRRQVWATTTTGPRCASGDIDGIAESGCSGGRLLMIPGWPPDTNIG